MEELKNCAIELLGAGYYSFGAKAKTKLYDESRQKIGAFMALIYFYLNDAGVVKKIASEVELSLLPSYSSLIKRLDKKNESNKNL